LSPKHHVFTTTLSIEKKPSTFVEAAHNPMWQDAMREEHDALNENGTWSLVPLPHGKRLIGCKWAYKIKLRADETVERYKIRLMTKEYNQIEGLDYQEILPP
ncbi:uncharacterized protein LOC110037451, partial [Phalaenopsis equestris]|uniref:uncharacterized protein LOC110037451 n=1 Tax=Phalaenopsis equestris TaxID=78828 RepID=UPI0009E1E9B2